MGIYNTYGGVQLKVSPNVCMANYDIGEKVDIEDGLYVGWDGFVVVLGGKLVAMFPTMRTTWGGTLTGTDVMRPSASLDLQEVDLDIRDGRAGAGKEEVR